MREIGAGFLTGLEQTLARRLQMDQQHQLRMAEGMRVLREDRYRRRRDTIMDNRYAQDRQDRLKQQALQNQWAAEGTPFQQEQYDDRMKQQQLENQWSAEGTPFQQQQYADSQAQLQKENQWAEQGTPFQQQQYADRLKQQQLENQWSAEGTPFQQQQYQNQLEQQQLQNQWGAEGTPFQQEQYQNQLEQQQLQNQFQQQQYDDRQDWLQKEYDLNKQESDTNVEYKQWLMSPEANAKKTTSSPSNILPNTTASQTATYEVLSPVATKEIADTLTGEWYDPRDNKFFTGGVMAGAGVTGAWGAAKAGAMGGAFLGPKGAIIGGLLGLGAGLIGAQAAKAGADALYPDDFNKSATAVQNAGIKVMQRIIDRYPNRQWTQAELQGAAAQVWDHIISQNPEVAEHIEKTYGANALDSFRLAFAGHPLKASDTPVAGDSNTKGFNDMMQEGNPKVPSEPAETPLVPSTPPSRPQNLNQFLIQ